MPCLVFKDKAGRRIEITLDKPRITVGRQPGIDVVIPSRSVSRRHCAFTKKPDGVYVEDLGSSNGSLVNDASFTKEVRLKHKDQVKIGEFRIRYYEASKYPGALSMEATGSLVLFKKEIATPAGAASPRRVLPLLLLLGGAIAGAIVVAIVVLVLLRTGFLTMGQR